MTREDFAINGTRFQHVSPSQNKYYAYEIDASVYASHVDGSPKVLLMVYRLFAGSLHRVFGEPGMHIDLEENGVTFWKDMGGIYLNSRLYSFDEFELISTPALQEPSAQGA